MFRTPLRPTGHKGQWLDARIKVSPKRDGSSRKTARRWPIFRTTLRFSHKNLSTQNITGLCHSASENVHSVPSWPRKPAFPFTRYIGAPLASLAPIAPDLDRLLLAYAILQCRLRYRAARAWLSANSRNITSSYPILLANRRLILRPAISLAGR